MADSLLSDGIRESATCVQKHTRPEIVELCKLRIIHFSVMAKTMFDLIGVHFSADYKIIYQRKICSPGVTQLLQFSFEE